MNNLKLMLLSLVFALGLGEIGLQLAGYPAGVAYVDDYNQRQIMARLTSLRERMERGEDIRSWLPVSPGAANLAGATGRPLMLSGFADTLTAYAVEDDGLTVYRSDENGYRNPPGAYARPVDVLMLGDSFVHGCCVDDGKTIPDVIRARSGLGVYNLGLGGVGLVYMLASYTEYGQAKAPPLAILTVVENMSLARSLNEARARSMGSYLTDPRPRLAGLDRDRRDAEVQRQMDYLAVVGGMGLRAELQTAYDRLNGGVVTAAKMVLKSSKLMNLVNSALARQGAALYGDFKELGQCDEATGDQARQILRQVLTRLVEAQAGHGGRVAVAYIPRTGLGDARIACDLPLYREEAALLNVPLIDLLEAFSGHPRPDETLAWGFGRDRRRGHFNAEGYRLVGEHMAARVPSLMAPAPEPKGR